jgi:Protein of unknown function (DUF2924)
MGLPLRGRTVMIETAPNSAITALVRSLPTLPKERLVELWKENFGKTPGKLRPELMWPILAFRIQERAYGGLSTETKDRLRQVIGSLEPQRRSPNEARNRFKPGTRLVREWRGKTHEVILTGDGYDYLGKRYKSLSPIACEITGTHWSGPAFFGTKKKEPKK